MTQGVKFQTALAQFEAYANLEKAGIKQNVKQIEKCAKSALEELKKEPSNDLVVIKLQQSIKSVQEHHSNIPHVDHLASQINSLATEGTLKTHFRAQSEKHSPSERMLSIPKALFSLLTKKIAKGIDQRIYAEWTKNRNGKKIEERIEKKLKEKYKQWYKTSIKNKTEPEISKLKQEFRDKQANIQSIIKDGTYVKDLTNDELNAIRIRGFNYEEWKSNKEKALETRRLFSQIGGERIELKTADGIKLDATYLSAEKFREQLCSQDARHVQISFGNDRVISGISLKKDQSKSPTAMIDILYQLNALKSSRVDAAHGILYEKDSKRYMIVKTQDLLQLANEKKIQWNPNKNRYQFKTDEFDLKLDEPILTQKDIVIDIVKHGGELKFLKIKGEDHAVSAVILGDSYHTTLPVVAIQQPSEKKIYILKEKADELVHSGKLVKTNGVYQWKKPQNVEEVSVEAEDFNQWEMRQSGVAILTSGAAGVYEMHKSEALTLLMQGCDVMMLNPRGFGESAGTPSAEGLYADLDAAYQFVKMKRKWIPDAKIVLCGYSLTGGVAAYLAEKHPRINLFLNKTYAEFSRVMKEKTREGINEYLKKFNLPNNEKHKLNQLVKSVFVPLISHAVKMVAPRYNVRDRLPKIEGQICILQAKDDTLMTKEEGDQMKAALDANHKDNYMFVEVPGGHEDSWDKTVIFKNESGVEVSAKDYVKLTVPKRGLFFLDKTKISEGQIIQKQIENEPSHFIKIHQGKNKNEVTYSLYEGNEAVIENQSGKIISLKKEEWKDAIADEHLTCEYIGHRQVTQFLGVAGLQDPIIA